MASSYGCLEMIHAPRLYQALRESLRLFPPWANPKAGSAPANGVGTTPNALFIRNGGDQTRARALDLAPFIPALPVTAGLRELKTLAA
jgi:hypothetical protein